MLDKLTINFNVTYSMIDATLSLCLMAKYARHLQNNHPLSDRLHNEVYVCALCARYFHHTLSLSRYVFANDKYGLNKKTN